jgi:hypothetical protein
MVTEKALLQSFAGLAALVRVLAGLDGGRLLGGVGIGGLDSRFRYLSGLLIGIGVAFMCDRSHLLLSVAGVHLTRGGREVNGRLVVHRLAPASS